MTVFPFFFSSSNPPRMQQATPSGVYGVPAYSGNFCPSIDTSVVAKSSEQKLIDAINEALDITDGGGIKLRDSVMHGMPWNEVRDILKRALFDVGFKCDGPTNI